MEEIKIEISNCLEELGYGIDTEAVKKLTAICQSHKAKAFEDGAQALAKHIEERNYKIINPYL